jgi:hypothetical protein
VPRIAFALLGPTASGKSALAIQAAQELPIEIVSLDSALVYRGMDIGTAKPGAELRASVPHHLIDIVDPDQAYSAGRWRADAIRIVGEILDRKAIPLLVGGTMLYYRALVAGLDTLPQADARVRAALDADEQGNGCTRICRRSIRRRRRASRPTIRSASSARSKCGSSPASRSRRCRARRRPSCPSRSRPWPWSPTARCSSKRSRGASMRCCVSAWSTS